jgi:hypothetical protein
MRAAGALGIPVVPVTGAEEALAAIATVVKR